MNMFFWLWLVIVFYRIDYIVDENNRKIKILEQMVEDTYDDMKYIHRYCNFTV